MVALGIGQAEQPLFQDRVSLIPQRNSQAQPLLIVADPGNAILTPSVRTGPRLIMAQVRPGVFAVAVILPDRPPLTLTEIRPPGAPWNTRPGFPQPPLLSQCRLAYFDHAAVLTFALVRMGLASLMVAGASWRVPCWPGFLTG